jgi:hypothetical protein
MSMSQNGFLLVLMQPPTNIEEEFNAWYDTEHVPERLSVPGVLTAIRFTSVTTATPTYLAIYDLKNEQVLDSEAYIRVAGENSSPWTKRVTGRTNVYRSIGNQIYPGNAITIRSARVTIVRFRGIEASAADSVVASLKKAFEGRASTLQLRVFAYHVGGKVDFIGFVSSSVPDDVAVDAAAFGDHAKAIDLFNTYAPR